MERKVENNVQNKSKSSFNRQQLKKRTAPKPIKRHNDIYITKKTNFKAQQKQCEDLLNSGVKEIFLHCMGNAINQCLNLALHLINNSNNTLSYEIHTSTVQLIDEMHPLCDDDELTMHMRNNSAVHIKILRNAAVFGVDVDC